MRECARKSPATWIRDARVKLSIAPRIHAVRDFRARARSLACSFSWTDPAERKAAHSQRAHKVNHKF